jgi:putative spermidine/putrescine transport system substrate-binding protein
MFASYKVATWNDIPDNQKSPTGLYTQDYGGYMAIGYDSSKVPEITSVGQLLLPAFKGKVALFADPTESASALTAVMMTSLANEGSLDDIGPGAKFFGALKKAGNFVPVAATNATVQNGTTPVVINWDYLAVAFKQSVPKWKVFIPANAAISSFYNAAINKDAPHPAAARLWTEFLFSDEGQNLFLAGGARPVRTAEMTGGKTIDTVSAAELPAAPATSQVMTTVQATAANSYLKAHWPSEVG